jgi:hypothetical protein
MENHKCCEFNPGSSHPPEVGPAYLKVEEGEKDQCEENQVAIDAAIDEWFTSIWQR